MVSCFAHARRRRQRARAGCRIAEIDPEHHQRVRRGGGSPLLGAPRHRLRAASARAARDDLARGSVVSGASTITMQLARLLHPHAAQLAGKPPQVLWALRLEAHLASSRSSSSTSIACSSARRGRRRRGEPLYFGASRVRAERRQAAMLAGLAHAPSRDNPLVSPATRARAARARARAHATRSAVATTRAMSLRALQEPLSSRRARRRFSRRTSRRACCQLDRESSGIRRAECAPCARRSISRCRRDRGEVRHTVDDLHDRGVEHAAVVVLDNDTGEVLAWVGSPDFWRTATARPTWSCRRASRDRRSSHSSTDSRSIAASPGNGLARHPAKPIATATGPYHPRNYDRRFRGPVRAREALGELVQRSRGGARVAASASRSLLETLHLAGFASLAADAEYYGLGLALGNGDVTLIELANAYRAFANGGEWRPWTWQRARRDAAAAGNSADVA